MSLLDAIENLRARPEQIRRQILAGSLIIAMVLIVGIWTGLMVYKSQSKSQASTVDNAKNNNGPNPIDVLKKTFSAASDEFKNLSGSAFNALTPKEVYTNNPKN